MQHPQKLMEIPYKTCRLWILLGPFAQNGPQKYPKSIRFSSKSWRRFTTSQNIKKPLVKQCFGAHGKVHQNTLQNLSIMETFGTVFAKWHSKVSKSIRFFTKSGWRFRTSPNIEKPLVKQRFGASNKVAQNTYNPLNYALRAWRPSDRKSFREREKAWKPW